MKKYLLLFLAIGLVFGACKKSDDDPFIKPVGQEPEPEQQPEPDPDPDLASDFPIQDFMWQTMNAYYFWQADVPDLADSRFTGPTDPNYVAFLKSRSNPADFFYNICYMHQNVVGVATAIDRFSFHAEDYRDLVQSFQGVSKSNGLEFGLSLYGNNNDVFGYVQYVVANSNAATKDIARGDIFTEVDGTGLYYNSASDNNLDLLFGNNDTYTLGMADIVDNTIIPNDKEVTLTKEEGLAENPVHKSSVIDYNGQKIGYIMYNQFVSEYDEDLNNAFGDLAGAGVTDLILDLRYNPGGFVSSAVLLSSLIYGPNTNDLLLKARYNEKIQSTFQPGDGERNFVATTSMGSAINALNLSRVYVIATGGSASASELVMNGLVPYIDVIHVGSTTVGKNEFSVTFVDDPANGNFYDADRVDQINPANQWAIQPLLGRNENADGFSDYTAGLMPDVEILEDIANLGTLADPTEPLLQATLQEIAGVSGKFRRPEYGIAVDYIASSKKFQPLGENMFMDFDGDTNILIKTPEEQ